MAERQTGHKLKIIRSDNGSEFVNKRMNAFCTARGIRHQLTVEYTPEQNGVAERANRTITEKARTMLEESGLSRKLWAESVSTAVYLKNRSPTIAVKNKTPEEAWSGNRVDLSHIRVFGCKAYLHVPDQKRKKWDSKSKPLVLVGYCEDTKGYRLVDPATGELFKGRDVIFFENKNVEYKDKASENEAIPLTENVTYQEVELERTQVRGVQDMSVLQETGPIEPREVSSENNIVEEEDDAWETPDERDGSDAEESNNFGLSERRYPLRERKEKRYPDFITYNAVSALEEPLTVQDALSREDNDKWRNAIQEEMNSLKKNNTWTLVEPPANCNIIDSKWLFKIKEEPGNRTRYKARLVARGFRQRRGWITMRRFHRSFDTVH